jgi:hypothetical protein
MENTDSLILDHLGRYTLSIRRIIDDLCFEGRSSGNALQRLMEKQLVQRVSKALEGNYSYYQLSAKGAKERGLPPNRSAAKGEAAVAQNLAALWFSCKSPIPRKRLTDDELKTLFGVPEGGNVIHVAQLGDQNHTTVFRLFIPGESSSVKKAYVRSLRKSAIETLTDERLLPWIERGTYRFAILVHSDVRKDELERLIRLENFPRLRIHIEVAPTPSTLPSFLSNQEDL